MNHGYFLWMSYGMTAVAVTVELAALAWRLSRARRRIEEERDLETQD
jgi:heme exporter protein CcmD